MKLKSLAALAVVVFVGFSHAEGLQGAGDLDSDGRLDFIVESPRNDGGTTVELWLSGQRGAARYTECRVGC
jgi:hypothetical protein